MTPSPRSGAARWSASRPTPLYGLATVPSAKQRLYEVKQRPESVEVPIFVADMEQARSLAAFTPLAEKLAARFWPGMLTIVVDGVGLRVPDHDVPLALCRAVGPIAVTSANLHGQAAGHDRRRRRRAPRSRRRHRRRPLRGRRVHRRRLQRLRAERPPRRRDSRRGYQLTSMSPPARRVHGRPQNSSTVIAFISPGSLVLAHVRRPSGVRHATMPSEGEPSRSCMTV